MLTNLGDDQSISLGDPVELFHHIGAGETCRIVFQREFIFILLDMFYPVFVSVLIQLRKQAFEHLPSHRR